MQKRKPIGISEGCNSGFKSSKISQDEADAEIKAAFDVHMQAH